MKIHRHRCQIPEDFLDLERQFVALHPTQCRPLQVERADGTLLQPHEKDFARGETIVFREFGIEEGNRPTRPRDKKPFDWEVTHAEQARDDPPLRDKNAPPPAPPGHVDSNKGRPPVTEAHHTASPATRRLAALRAGRKDAKAFSLAKGAGAWYAPL